MSIFELFLIAVGLSMDAFAVAVSMGLTMKTGIAKKGWITGAYFGLFQALMPLIGYLVGTQFTSLISAFDHWIAFGLLAFIGGQMIWSSLKKDERKTEEASVDMKSMLPLAVATSIDALAVGVSFAFLSVSIVPAVSFVGVITFLLSAAGVWIGHLFGARFASKAELFGGAILMLIGVKILLEHTNVL